MGFEVAVPHLGLYALDVLNHNEIGRMNLASQDIIAEGIQNAEGATTTREKAQALRGTADNVGYSYAMNWVKSDSFQGLISSARTIGDPQLRADTLAYIGVVMEQSGVEQDPCGPSQISAVFAEAREASDTVSVPIDELPGVGLDLLQEHGIGYREPVSGEQWYNPSPAGTETNEQCVAVKVPALPITVVYRSE